jgi:hypothetical protein
MEGCSYRREIGNPPALGFREMERVNEREAYSIFTKSSMGHIHLCFIVRNQELHGTRPSRH